ncbi:MAG TPA: hypothetical protein VEK10_02355 [Steroidobacteraceae bacterium]|nr:hypothetical protein [Steroidobacteraceae bacterium]
MKVTSLVLFTALSAGAFVLAQGQGRVNSQVAQACKAEIQQLCQGQKGQAAEQCLRNNQAKLSSQCKDAITKAPQQ